MTVIVNRKDILELIPDYYKENFKYLDFNPNNPSVPVTGKQFDSAELVNLVDASLDLWITGGRYTKEFEKELANFVGVRNAIFCNSGSSANLLAMSALTSPILGSRQVLPGDEVITVAAGFPTTINPIIQNNCIPVFLDITLPTYEIDAAQIENAITSKTKAIFLAHTLGNPFDLGKIKELCDKYKIWLIEDMCDALGSKYGGKNVGTFGDLATLSFYPAHHITTGEGGAVLTDKPILKKIVESFRDWGRDCWCETGMDNTCQKRFGHKLGELPFGYDHKFTYSHRGYNLKATDLQAAIGLAQIKKIDKFVKKRKENWLYLYEGLKQFSESIILPEPTENSDPSWFGFCITLKKEVDFKLYELTKYLNEKGIGTRQLFAGNILRQPSFKDVKYHVVGEMKNTDYVMNNTFWIGCWPGLNENHLNYAVSTIKEFIQHKKS